jgi:hypothetical protein
MGCRLSSNPSSECRATILIIRTTYPFAFDVGALQGPGAVCLSVLWCEWYSSQLNFGNHRRLNDSDGKGKLPQRSVVCRMGEMVFEPFRSV